MENEHDFSPPTKVLACAKGSPFVGGNFSAMENVDDPIGQRFGKLVVLRRDDNSPKKWVCKCDCGNIHSVATDKLRSGHTQSCGCLRGFSFKERDLTGLVFGRLTVLHRDESNPRKWICHCECGKEKPIYGPNLTRGLTKSCGCYSNELASKRVLLDITGKVYGKLTVLRRGVNDKGGRPKWVCQCSCGKIVEVAGWDLRHGHTKSCGCLLNVRKKTNRPPIAHKRKMRTDDEIRLSHIFQSMKQRCTYKHNGCYKRYGGRGISICSEWMESKESFVEWALSHGYKSCLTIERIDNDGPYAPWNCRWATRTEQANNRRTSKFISVQNERHTLAEWARLLNVRYIEFWKKPEHERVEMISEYLSAKTA